MSFLNCCRPTDSMFQRKHKMIIPSKYIFGGVFLVATHFSIAYYSYHKGYNQQEKESITSMVEAIRNENKILMEKQKIVFDGVNNLTATLDNSNQVEKSIDQKVYHEIQKPVYVATIVPATGMQQLAAAAAALNAARNSSRVDGTMQGTDTTKNQ